MGTRVIVTGGAGFIGSEVVKLLLEQGHTVRVADDLSKKEARIPDGAEFVRVDLTAPGAATEVFKGVSRCINLAAKIGGIGYFHKYPATILSENNKILSATFEAASDEGVDRMLYVSSSMVFESARRFPSKETDITETPPPITAYGFSKLSGEWYCKAFGAERGLPYTICRPFNAYGVNEYPTVEVGYAHVIPDLIRKLLRGQDPLEILGDGQQTRCYTHVRDLARGIVTALFHPAGENEDFNLSNARETTVLDLVDLLWRSVGRTGEPRLQHADPFRHDVRKRLPDTTKAREVLGFEAEIPLEEGVKEVVEWLVDEHEAGRME